MSPRNWMVSAAMAVTLGACASLPPTQAEMDAANTAFDALIEDMTGEMLADSPELATYLGVPAEMAGGPYLGRLDDHGLSGRERTREVTAEMIAELTAVDPAPLSEQRQLTREILLELLSAGEAADEAAGGWGTPGGVGFSVYPVNQLGGLHIGLPNLMQAQQPVTDESEADAYLSRLGAFPEAFDDAIEVIAFDAEAGVIPPDFVLEKTLGVIARFTESQPTENVLYTAFARKLDAAEIDEADDYLEDAEELIEDEIYPAYGRLADALEELLPEAKHHAGVDGQPNGEALYNAMIRINADSGLSADEIHDIGLAEVDRITEAMETILQAEGYEEGSIGERMDVLQKEARFIYPNTDDGKAELISDLNDQVAEIQALAPEWFGTIPEQPVEVRRVPEFSEESAPGGYYDLPSLDGTRPGIYWINLRDTANNPSFSLPTLTYHEAVPGHHYQIALALALEDIPLLRKVVGITNAYVEGWALYSEQVAYEMGMYADDPYGDLGRLQSELFRAVRLVVDTGIHAKGWSREQAIDYMVDTGAAIRSDAIIEIERYAAWPGQALGYKMGMIKIGELRARAEEALGEDFDIRDFHDAVLTKGGMPLPVLERQVDAWIAGVQAG